MMCLRKMCIAWQIGSVRMVVFCKFVSLTFGCRIQGKSTPNPGPWERYLSTQILVHDLFHSEWILVHKPHLYSIHIHIINHYIICIYLYIIELQHISKQSHTQVGQLHGLLSVLPQPFKLLPFFGKISLIQPCPHHKGPTLFTMSKGFAYILQIHPMRFNRRSLNHQSSIMGTCPRLTRKHESIHPKEVIMSCLSYPFRASKHLEDRRFHPTQSQRQWPQATCLHLYETRPWKTPFPSVRGPRWFAELRAFRTNSKVKKPWKLESWRDLVHILHCQMG